MDLDITIERILNGFIVTDGGSSIYYDSMRSIVERYICSSADIADKYFNEHDAEGETRRLTFRIFFQEKRDA